MTGLPTAALPFAAPAHLGLTVTILHTFPSEHRTFYPYTCGYCHFKSGCKGNTSILFVNPYVGISLAANRNPDTFPPLLIQEGPG